jgi:hypothetical protein
MSAKGLKLKQQLQADLDFQEELRSSNEFPAVTASQEGGRTLQRPDAGAAVHSAAPAVSPDNSCPTPV